jgi:SAM-dependent methyltransferase
MRCCSSSKTGEKLMMCSPDPRRRVSAPGVIYDDVAGQMAMFMAPSARILVLGCANVAFVQHMYDDGYHDITCMHPSERAIHHMKQQYGNRNIKWLVLNPIGNNGLRDSQFDAVIDKGFLDTLKNKSTELVETWLQEMVRIVAPRGVFLCFTFADEDVYFNLFNDYDLAWSSKCILIPIGADAFSHVVLFANQKSFGTLEEEATIERSAALARTREAFVHKVESFSPESGSVHSRGAAANRLYQPALIQQATRSGNKVSTMVALLKAVAQAFEDRRITEAEYNLIKGALVKYHPNEKDLAFVADQLSKAVALDCSRAALCSSSFARVRQRYAGLTES